MDTVIVEPALRLDILGLQVFGHSLVLAATGVAAYAGWRQLSYCYHLVAASGSRI